MTIIQSFVGAKTEFNANVALIGISATGAIGSLIAGSNVVVTLGSVTATALLASPSITASASTVLNGVAATANTASANVVLGEIVNVTGVAATASVGSSVANIITTVAVESVEATALLASPSVTASVSTALNGVNATGNVASVNVVPEIALGLTGVAATGSTANVDFKLSASVSVNGVTASGQISGISTAITNALPEGAVLLFDRESVGTAIPTGFSLYTEYEGDSVVNFLIKGGSTVSRSTGTSASVSLTSPAVITTDTAGVHPGAETFRGRTIWTNPTPGTSLYIYLKNTGGSHSHTVTLSGSGTYPESATLEGMSVPLIEATTPKNIPQGAIIFSGTSTVFSNFSRKTWATTKGVYNISSSVNESNPSPTPVSPSFSAAISNAGSHYHGRKLYSNTGFIGPEILPPAITRFPFREDGSPTAPTIHNHGESATIGPVGVYKQFKHLLPLVASTETGVEPGMIVMFNGAAVPSGWFLCDGTNETPDMQNYFLGFNNDNSNSNTLTGRDVVGGSSGPTATTPAPPPSSYAVEPVSLDTGNDDWVHDHRGTGAIPSSNGPNPSSPYSGHEEKPFPHSHTATTDKFTMPNTYTPQHLVLLFIQKAA